LPSNHIADVRFGYRRGGADRLLAQHAIFIDQKGHRDSLNEEIGAVGPSLRGATTYRIALGPQQGAKCSPKATTVGTLQTLPACEPDDYADTAGKVSGFSLHAGVAARSDERKKLERLSEGGPAVTSVGQRFRKSGFR
jgi:hypothetical protein